jgi:hypothetical protein
MHMIVKTVYAMTQPGFVKRILRFATFDSVSSAWKDEWGSSRYGELWRNMASGTEIDRLAFSARSRGILSGGGVGSRVLGYRSAGGSCLHYRNGCSNSCEVVESNDGDVPLKKCSRCWPQE